VTELLTPQEIADMLKVPVRIAQEKVLRSAGFPPPTINLSQKVRRWSRADVEGWIERKARQNSR
jgi:predicted DNA-binding transcriptional regulator AlpA